MMVPLSVLSFANLALALPWMWGAGPHVSTDTSSNINSRADQDHSRHPFFANASIFTAPSDWTSHRTSYARTVLLNQNHEHDNVLLASWSLRPPGRVYAPIYQSKDLGMTWHEKTKVFFSAADEGKNSSILQVFLYELPQKVGAFPRGTVLLTANAIPNDKSSTNIQMYASTDKG